MELVYLWVEKHNNIENQGFNFSPRFSCNYDPGNGKLMICDKNEELAPKCNNNNYIKDIFGVNINITAIVGKNGSGKTSLLEALDFSLKDVYYIYYSKRKLYSNYFKESNSGVSIQKGEMIIGIDIIPMNKCFLLQRNNKFFSLDSSLYEENLYVKKSKIKSSKVTGFNSDIFHKNILELIFKQNYLGLNFFNPQNIRIQLNPVDRNLDIMNIITLFADEIYNSPIRYYKGYLKSKELLEPYKDKIELSEEEKNNLIKQYEEFLIQEEKQLNEYNYDIDEDLSFFLFDIDETTILSFIKNILPINTKQIKIKEFYENYLKKSNNDNGSNYSIFYYLYKIGFLEFDIFDENNKDFSSLSSGEKTLFTDFCLLTEKLKEELKNTDDDKIERIIILDEPDLTLHPEWQKGYINLMVHILKRYKKINFHLIFTTHSPFLLSDIPKQNIIFLDTYKENDEKVKKGLQKVGNCKVPTKDEVLEKKQTFGANIHTLLSNSFFMSDGLMGEFAKSKIEEVIKFLNNEKSEIKDHREVESIINIIGEPILQKKLQVMLERYKEENNLVNPQDIEKQIQALQEKLNRIHQNG